ncbi:hypothetical protein HN385_02285 [archaeon]|nr:hypothetical protein [archaeon]MBT3450383.1 hypothetical protein [archaeon]MBT6868842.1 hypothetical protein [archaeon]MBT7192937.1 hypothetical protein [archaeon]MBT7380903.1 hypothetical protein [archaeon]
MNQAIVGMNKKMSKISWCWKQKNGFEIIEPNTNLSNAYLIEARTTLKKIVQDGNRTNYDKWDLIMSYYSCYNALYSILMKAGIKCELHSCTIEMMKFIESFTDEDYEFLMNLKDKRIDVQYYLKDYKINENQIKKVKLFVHKCEVILNKTDLSKLRGELDGTKK